MTNNNKDHIRNFFDNDSREYLKYKYNENSLSFMALRKQKTIELLLEYLVPSLDGNVCILDAGCGPGIMLDFFCNYKLNYFGLDISKEMLSIARHQKAIPPLHLESHFIRGDVENLPFRSDHFNAVISLGVIEYLADDRKFIAELHRVIRPDGLLLISITNKYSYNLLLDGLIEYLRKKRLAVIILDYLKQKLRLGQFKERGFSIRKHYPKSFINELEYHDFKVVMSVNFGFNFLPYPLNLICSERINNLTNTLYNKMGKNGIKQLGEGCLVLCRK